MKTLINLSLLFYVLFNALGSVPAFVTLLKEFSPQSQTRIIIREMLFALLTILIFILVGTKFFNLFGISLYDFQLGGGLLLFLVALKMVFAKPIPNQNNKEVNDIRKEPVFFPLAFPIITGPAVLTNLLIYMHGNSYPQSIILGAIFISWFASLLTLLCSSFLYKTMGRNGLHALERLFGLVLLMMASNLILKGFVSSFDVSSYLSRIGTLI